MVGIKPLLAVITFVAVAFSGCTEGSSSFSEPAPEWRAGYTWSFDTTVEGEYIEEEDGETYNETWDESYREVLEVLNTTQVMDGRQVYLTAHQIGDWGNNLVAVRADDLSSMWVEWDDCDDADCVAPLELELYQSHDEVPRQYAFPLAGGSAWADTLASDDEFDISIQVSSRVTGTKVIETQLGAIDTIQVQRSLRILNLQEVLNVLREEIESEGGKVIRLDGDFRADITDHYAPVYQHTVRSVVTETSRFHLEVEFEGERMSEKERSQTVYTTELVGATLSAGPEKSLGQIADYLFGRVQLQDPAGQAVADAGYDIAIEAVADDINVADGESLRFQAVVDGVLPVDHELTWTVMDLIGTTVATGTGDTLEAVPSLPGVYFVALQSKAGGDVVKSAAATAVGHFRAQLTSACGLAEVAGNGVPTDCQEVPIPVRIGITSLDIQATTGSLADTANRGSIRLTDGMGNIVDASQRGDAKRLQLGDEMYAYAVAASTWDLDWYQTVGAGEAEVVFDVDLTYGGMPDGVVMMAETVPPVAGLQWPDWLQGNVSLL